MLKEFKEFALKGNLIDMAIAFVMGGAFGKVTTAFVDGMVAPLVGLISGGQDLTKLKWVITPQSTAADGSEIAEVAVKYGTFITEAINFLIVAFVMFMIVKAMNKMKKAEAAAPPPPPPAQEVLLAEIRDLLKK